MILGIRIRDSKYLRKDKAFWTEGEPQRHKILWNVGSYEVLKKYSVKRLKMGRG